MRKSLVAIALASAFGVSPALASFDIYLTEMTGAQEVPGPGDPNGFGVGTLTIDNVALTVSWSFLTFNIDMPLTGAHIHTGAAGVSGGVIVNFANQLSGVGLFDADLASINPGNAHNFYVNLHNAAFPAGAIRGQLQYLTTSAVPEPETYALMLGGLGIVGWMARRRRQS